MQLLNNANIAAAPPLSGVYKIWALAAQQQPIAIQRFCGTDLTGLLYIGRTTGQTFPARIYQFYAAAMLNSTGHSGGLKYRTLQIIQQTLGAGHQLWFDCFPHPNPIQFETQLIQNYKVQYGECPPLNS